MPLSAGAKLGPYEIVAPIGAGGMGEVYKARDTRLDRIVALKVSKTEFTERFEREARAIAALNHPHVCQLYDIGPNYLVMEYIGGAPLRGPLPLDQVLKHAAQICDALDAAHQKGIAHRDLKPGNILVTKSGVKLLDFGLARRNESDVTVTMAVMGTPAYMAPEQWDGKPGDARSDIYALGCVLHEMLTGSPERPDRQAVEPAAIESVIRTCLAKDPEERWQSARDVKAALSVAAARDTVSPANPLRERAGWIAAGAAALVAVVFLALWLGRAPAVGEKLSFAIYPPPNTVFSSQLNTTVNVPQFALSPDGRAIVFAAVSGGDKPMVWRRLLSEVTAQPLAGTENAQDPFWSPDGQWLGFFADGTLKRVPYAGGTVQTVAQTSDFRGATWGAQDTILFANLADPVRRVTPTGGPATAVTNKEPWEGSHRYPLFLSDGRHFLFSSIGSSKGSGVYAGSLGDKTKKLLIRMNTGAVYAPPGYLLFSDGDRLLGQAFDEKRLEVSGQNFVVAEHVGRSSTSRSAVSASGNDTIAYAGTLTANGRLTWFDRSGKASGSVGQEGYYSDFSISPDQKSVAGSLLDFKTGGVDLWMTDLLRGATIRFTNSPGGLLSASAIWSPDGKRVAFRTNIVTSNEIYQRSASGGGNNEPLTTQESLRAGQVNSGNIVPSDWSPDGRHILFSVPAASGNEIWLLPLTGDRKPIKFLATPADELHGNFSPNGHFVAYTSNESGKFEVYVQTFPLSDVKKQVSTNGGYEPRWRADGREIYYLSEDRKLMAVSVGPGPSFGVPQPLFQTRVASGVTAIRTHYVPNRDGQRFLINTQIADPAPTPITVVLNWTSGLKQ
jgi:eukaryotic-like serine/threonine-protein kinase